MVRRQAICPKTRTRVHHSLDKVDLGQISSDRIPTRNAARAALSVAPNVLGLRFAGLQTLQCGAADCTKKLQKKLQKRTSKSAQLPASCASIRRLNRMRLPVNGVWSGWKACRGSDAEAEVQRESGFL